MSNYKIRVNSKSESKEAQQLFFELDYNWFKKGYMEVKTPETIMSFENGALSTGIRGSINHKEITLPELRDMVVLKRNDREDAGDDDYYESLKPIEKPMKEYLRKNSNGTYSYIGTVRPEHVSDFMIEVPSGMNIYWKEDGDYWFTTQVMGYRGAKIIWQRPTHPEELPFIDDEPSLNDQYAEIETVRQSAWQKQEGGSHYKNLKIQPMQYALENKLDYAQANVIKYVTRHADKNGKEDLLKAIHNLELMIEFYYGDEK